MIVKYLINYVAYVLTRLIPKKKNRWVFGAWYGTRISDNSKALCDYVSSNKKDIEIIWLTNDPTRCSDLGFRIIKRNSIKGIFAAMTAKVAVMNQGYGDICSLNVLGGVFKVQLWHGVTWKKIGYDALESPKTLAERINRHLLKAISRYDLYIAPSDEYASKLRSAFEVPEESVLMVGQPRNEILMADTSYAYYRDRLVHELGIDNSARIVLYLPTFRDKKSRAFSFFNEDIVNDITELGLNKNFVIVEKSHFVDSTREEIQKKDKGPVVYTTQMDTQELMAAADMLITDYSSCYFDFLITDRPIIHYIYDYEYYRDSDRGLYYSVEEAAGGAAVYDYQELKNELSNLMSGNDMFIDRRRMIRNKFVNYEAITNSKTICEYVLSKV